MYSSTFGVYHLLFLLFPLPLLAMYAGVSGDHTVFVSIVYIIIYPSQQGRFLSLLHAEI